LLSQRLVRGMGAASATKTSKKASSKTTDGNSKTTGDGDGVVAIFIISFTISLLQSSRLRSRKGRKSIIYFVQKLEKRNPFGMTSLSKNRQTLSMNFHLSAKFLQVV